MFCFLHVFLDFIWWFVYVKFYELYDRYSALRHFAQTSRLYLWRVKRKPQRAQKNAKEMKIKINPHRSHFEPISNLQNSIKKINTSSGFSHLGFSLYPIVLCITTITYLLIMMCFVRRFFHLRQRRQTLATCWTRIGHWCCDRISDRRNTLRNTCGSVSDPVTVFDQWQKGKILIQRFSTCKAPFNPLLNDALLVFHLHFQVLIASEPTHGFKEPLCSCKKI